MMAASSEQQQMLHSLAGYFSHSHNEIGLADMPLSQGFRWPELLTTASGGGSKKKKNKEVVESSEQSSRSMKRKKKEAEDAEPTSENPYQLPSITNEKRRKKDPADTCPPPSEKPDVIHVRARRGQATDSHSLAERARREKISERMKFLQDLVPGCKKITGKAGMLDEIINYVQSLQTQVQFLSMKLAAVTPAIDCDVDIESYLAKQMNSASNSVISQEMSSQMVAADASYLQLNPLQHGFECPELDVANELSLSELALQRTTSAPMPPPDVFLDPLFNLTTFNT